MLFRSDGNTDDPDPNTTEKAKSDVTVEAREEQSNGQKENASSDTEEKEALVPPKRRRGRPPKTITGA